MIEEVTLEEYRTFLVSYKGLEHINNPEPTEQFMNLLVEEVLTKEQFMTKWGEVNSLQTISILNNYLVYYVFTKSDSFHKLGVGNEDIEHLNTTYKLKSQVNPNTENLLKEDHATFTLN
jgi:hypothetical protein